MGNKVFRRTTQTRPFDIGYLNSKARTMTAISVELNIYNAPKPIIQHTHTTVVRYFFLGVYYIIHIMDNSVNLF